MVAYKMIYGHYHCRVPTLFTLLINDLSCLFYVHNMHVYLSPAICSLVNKKIHGNFLKFIYWYFCNKCGYIVLFKAIWLLFPSQPFFKSIIYILLCYISWKCTCTLYIHCAKGVWFEQNTIIYQEQFSILVYTGCPRMIGTE